MPIGPLVAYFFAGLFLANAVPHVVAGTMGEPFQSPFAKPPGKGESSSVVNAVWGVSNLVVGYVLLAHVGSFEIRDWAHAGAFFAGVALISVGLAKNFGALHGGNAPKDAK